MISDNGASGEGGPNGSFNEWRFFNGVADTTDDTLPHIDELGTPASYNHYNTGWAWALDTPFPYWKRWAGAEGGVADMCLVSWPARIPATTGRASSTSMPSTWCPTVYELLGIEPPEVHQGLPAEPHRRRELRGGAHRPDRAGQADAVLLDARAALDLPRRLARGDASTRRSAGGATSRRTSGSCSTSRRTGRRRTNVAAEDPSGSSR